MAKFTLDVTDEMKIKVFRDSMAYEILYALGVPLYDVWDYARWEYINYAKAAHARLLYDFFEGRGAIREANQADRLQDNVICFDYGFRMCEGLLSEEVRKPLNRRLLHFSFSRIDVPDDKRSWDDRILGDLLEPVVAFMKHILNSSLQQGK